jgi:hypothetical protein
LLQESEIGHYSCVKLLREMEAAEMESEDEILGGDCGEDELVCIPES